MFGRRGFEAALRKIEHWHQGSIKKVLCRDGKGFWHRVPWDSKTASVFPLQETDKRKVRNRLLER
jgi:hypothetical protein